MTNDQREDFGKVVVDAAYTVHKELGPGLLESAYELALMHELLLRGLNVQRHIPVSLKYKDFDLGKSYEIDLLVEHQIIIEVKSVVDMHPVYTAQIITYLKLHSNYLGFLINFNVPLIKNGIKRIVYNNKSA